MRLKIYLTELTMSANTKIKYTSSSRSFNAGITLESGAYFLFRGDIITKGQWYIYFEDEKGTMSKAPKERGVALQLFAALQEVLKNFIKTKKPMRFEFKGMPGEASREKLYNTIALRMPKLGYKKNPVPGAGEWSFTRVLGGR